LHIVGGVTNWSTKFHGVVRVTLPCSQIINRINEAGSISLVEWETFGLSVRHIKVAEDWFVRVASNSGSISQLHMAPKQP